MKYHTEFYNKIKGDEQWIRLGEGCPNGCEYCYSNSELIRYDIPEIKRNKVSILDMNFLYDPKHKERIKELGSRKVNGKVVYYELICGIDWRRLDQETANLLKENRFKNIRFAWDHSLKDQYKIKDCLKMLLKAGYKPDNMSCFILSDWKIPFIECLYKLFLLKNWNVRVSPCFFDNATPPNFQMNYWNYKECRIFQDLCSLHNQTVNFGIYPDLKRVKRVQNRFYDLINQKTLKRFGDMEDKE